MEKVGIGIIGCGNISGAYLTAMKSFPILDIRGVADLNFERRERAEELGERLGKSPIQVALAYVLNQPWPVIPLIGPRSLGELNNSLEAFEIKLSPADVVWLESGKGAQ